MENQSTDIGLALLSAVFIVSGSILIIGSWKKIHWLFESVGVDWLSRFVLERLGMHQKEEDRQCINYLVGVMSILLGVILLFLI